MEIHIEIVKHLLKCYFKHIYIILVGLKLQTYCFKSSPHIFLFQNRVNRTHPKVETSWMQFKHLKMELSVWRAGAVVRARASHQCAPGLIHRLCVICGLCLLVLNSAPRGVSLGTPVFPSPRKPAFDLIYVNCWFQFTVSPISAPSLE